ncbi:MAG: small basic family protein [Armatimonadetes bacterium]|nr:small basic family protein [Armatimonadota bacterium]
MWLGLIALLFGLVLGLWLPSVAVLPANLQQQLPNYLGLAILAAIDATLGAWRANMEGTYDVGVFLSGFFVNTIAAASLAYIGDLLGVNLALAAIVAFGTRIFNNLAAIRRIMLQRWRQKMSRVG